jgi:hypothetical protein
MGLLSACSYLTGTLCLIPGTVLLLPAYSTYYVDAIHWLVVACSILTFAGLLDFSEALWQFRAPVSVSPTHHKIDTKPKPELKLVLTLFFMLSGGILILAGSVLFHPTVDLSATGLLVFRSGNISYIVGGCLSIHSILKAPRGVAGARLATAGVMAYIVGASLYILGGVMSQQSWAGSGAMWVIGSCFFVIGALSFMPWPKRDSSGEDMTDGLVTDEPIEKRTSSAWQPP